MAFSGLPKGFTLVELLVVVILVAILAAFAVPGFNRMIDSNRTLAASNELVNLLQYARTIAVENRSSVHVCVDDDGVIAVKPTCGSAEVLRALAGATGVTISAKLDDVLFRFNGTASAGSLPVNYLICREDDFASGFTVSIAASGSVRLFPRGKKNATVAMTECTES